MIKFGSLQIDPAALGSQGNAVLGIRDSGKTYTATALAERLYEAGVPFTAFDPTGVWRFLRIPGKGRGYPIVVAGGEAGDLPLNPASAPKIVEAAMQSGVSLVIDLFDANLSKADWRRIVKDSLSVLMHKNRQYGLRHIFLEEAAEFAPQKVLDGDVYAVVERLARMGGNFRLGYTLINQRSQEVNKAVLELCENMFLHRQKGKNALENLKKWLEVATDSEAEEITKTISTLPSGECWAWMAGFEHPKLLKVPVKNSFHPDRRVMHGDTAVVTKDAVDVGRFVEGLKGALPVIEAEAKANDPKALRAEVSRLTKELARKSNGAAPMTSNDEIRVRSEGYNAGWTAAKKDAARERASFAKALEAVRNLLGKAASTLPVLDDAAPAHTSAMPSAAPLPVMAARSRTTVPKAAVRTEGVTKPQQRVLDALAWWAAAGHETPSREQVAGVASYAPTSGNFNNIIGQLNANGWTVVPAPGRLQLTAEGAKIGRCAEAPTVDDLHERVQQVLTGPQWKLMATLIDAHPEPMTRDALGEATEYAATSGNFNNLIGQLSSLRMIEKPQPGHVRAADWLFEVQT